jgi:hypothetical protein
VFGGATYKGYIPKDFVSDEIVQDVEWQGFTYETFGSSSVYLDENLVYPTLFNIYDGQKVKVLSIDNNVCKIYYESDGSAITGYVSASLIKAPQDSTIRDVIIILVLSVGFVVTAFFIVVEKVKR